MQADPTESKLLRTLIDSWYKQTRANRKRIVLADAGDETIRAAAARTRRRPP
jgi:hypothetical protein